jgi:hypothetical protein
MKIKRLATNFPEGNQIKFQPDEWFSIRLDKIDKSKGGNL